MVIGAANREDRIHTMEDRVGPGQGWELVSPPEEMTCGLEWEGECGLMQQRAEEQGEQHGRRLRGRSDLDVFRA